MSHARPKFWKPRRAEPIYVTGSVEIKKTGWYMVGFKIEDGVAEGRIVTEGISPLYLEDIAVGHEWYGPKVWRPGEPIFDGHHGSFGLVGGDPE